MITERHQRLFRRFSFDPQDVAIHVERLLVVLSTAARSLSCEGRRDVRASVEGI